MSGESSPISMDQRIREEARLIILKALAGQTNESLSSPLLLGELETYGIVRLRPWVHGELDYLADMGAVTLVQAGSIKIAKLTDKGHLHLSREIAIEGVKRPSRSGS